MLNGFRNCVVLCFKTHGSVSWFTAVSEAATNQVIVGVSGAGQDGFLHNSFSVYNMLNLGLPF